MASLLQSIYSGVDPTLEGNGGPACANYLPSWRYWVETVLVSALATAYIMWGWRRVVVPKKMATGLEHSDRIGQRLLLVLMCLVFGCEIGFKLATRTLIYLLNPCHIITAVQIFLLAAPPSRLVTVVFRYHLPCLNGAVLALAFPVLNTRLLPFEKEIYFIQHLMMLVIPFYLLRVGGVYTVERMGDFSWSVMTVGMMLLYHYTVLQFLGLLTEVNLNNMLCPAVSDPFRGPNYRLWATFHQSVLIGTISKAFVLICKLAFAVTGHTRMVHDPEDFPVTNHVSKSNGHTTLLSCNSNAAVQEHSKSVWSGLRSLWSYCVEKGCPKSLWVHNATNSTNGCNEHAE